MYNKDNLGLIFRYNFHNIYNFYNLSYLNFPIKKYLTELFEIYSYNPIKYLN